MKPLSITKLYFSISEVSRLTDLEQYVLRYWEQEFDQLKPGKNRAGNRIYTQRDISLILAIKHLLRDERYTLDGAKRTLDVGIPDAWDNTAEVDRAKAQLNDISDEPFIEFPLDLPKSPRAFSLNKIYYSISEVSKVTDLEQHVLRYWETQFSQLKPSLNRSGNRIYTPRDINLIIKIKDLLRNQRYSLEGAKTLLANSAQVSNLDHDTFQKTPTKSIIEIATKVESRLIAYFSKHPEDMRQMNRRKFEELIAELFLGFGFEVELTSQTRDGGRDIVALKSGIVSVKYLIECKRPDPGNYVSIAPVRQLFGVKVHEGATKAILATTAYFSKDAMAFFDSHKWELEPRDYQGIMDWISEYLKIRNVRD